MNILNWAKSKGQYFWKSLIIIFSVFMCFMIAVSSYLIVNSKHNTSNMIEAFENNEIEKTVTKVNAALYEASSVCSYLSTMNFGNEYFNLPTDDYQNYLMVQSQIDSYAVLFNFINEIYVQTANGNLYRTTKAKNTFPDIGKGEAAASGKMRNAILYFTGGSNAYENLYFQLLEAETPYAVNDVCISLNMIALAKQTLDYTNNREEYVIDKTGCIICSNDADKIGCNFYDVHQMKRNGVADSTRQVNIGKTKYMVTMEKVKDTELYAASITNMSYYAMYFKSNISFSIFVCLCFLVIAVMVCLLVLRISYRPIQDILLQIKQYQNVNIDKNTNEVNYINNKLEELYQSNVNLDKTTRQALSELKSWNIAALQAQICPHFLYNTLDSINWLAFQYLDTDNPISVAVQDMAYIMRLSLDISRMFSSIKEEVEVVKKYIEIIDIRHEHRYTFVWDIDEDVLNCVIPRLCIQPLIENAVQHAFIGITQNNEIKITLKGYENKIKITVSDNGEGIPLQKLAQIRVNINTGGVGNEKNVGLRNIHMRCKIIYGDEYGLTIKSSAGQGSHFCIMIPKDEYID